MIKNIIFDLGNVIVQNPSKSMAYKFFKEACDAETFCECIFKSDLWRKLDLGQITNREVADIIEAEKTN